MITQKLMSPVDINNSFAFSRASTAFTSDGRLVEANNARYEAAKVGYGNGLRIEESTANLLNSVGSDSQFGTLTGWTPYAQGIASIVADPNSITNGKVLSYVDNDGNTTTSTWDGVSSTIYPGNFNPGDTCTLTIRYRVTGMTTGNASVWSHWVGYDSNNNNIYDVGADLVLESGSVSDSGWKTVTQAWVTPSASSYPNAVYWKKFVRPGINLTNLGATILVDYIQVENKVYPTTFTPTTRLNEDLSFNPSGILNLPQGSIECMFYIDPAVHSTTASWSMVFSTVTINNSPYQEQNHFSVRKSQTSQVWNAYISDATGVTITVPLGTFTTAGWHQVNITWQTGVGVGVYFDGAQLRAPVATDSLPTGLNPLFYIGRWGGGGLYLNSLITDMRFSNIARTATEITNNYNSGAPLPVDANTTLKLNFNGPDAVRGAKSLNLGAL